MKTNDYIISDMNKQGTNQFLLGHHFYDRFCSEDRMEEMEKVTDYLTENKIYNVPTDYFRLFFDENFPKEDFYNGLNVFKARCEVKLGCPSIAIKMKFGDEFKEDSILSKKGQVTEWTYYAKSSKMDREVIAHKLRFTDGKLDQHEDKSEETYFGYNIAKRGLTGIGCKDIKESYSRTLVAFSDADNDYKKDELEKFKEFLIDNYNQSIIEQDHDLQSHNNHFKGYYASGKNKDLAAKMIAIYEQDIIEKHEIDHATEVLKNAKTGLTNIEYPIYIKSILEYAEKFIDRYDELAERLNHIYLMNTTELKENNISFEDKRKLIDVVYNECHEKYTKKIDEENLTPLYQQEVNEFKAAYQTAKETSEKKCFIATATLGDYDHPEVIKLRLFRDGYLLKRTWGQIFTKVYYQYGPYAANAIDNSFILKKISYFFIVKPLSIIASKLDYK